MACCCRSHMASIRSNRPSPHAIPRFHSFSRRPLQEHRPRRINACTDKHGRRPRQGRRLRRHDRRLGECREDQQRTSHGLGCERTTGNRPNTDRCRPAEVNGYADNLTGGTGKSSPSIKAVADRIAKCIAQSSFAKKPHFPSDVACPSSSRIEAVATNVLPSRVAFGSNAAPP